MQKFSLLYFFILPFLLFSQIKKNHQITGRLLYNQSGIPFGTIIFNHKKNGFNSDELGTFSFNWDGKLDTVFIECIGFKKEKIILNETLLGNNINIEMKPLSPDFVGNRVINLTSKSKNIKVNKNAFLSYIYPVFENTLQCGLKFDDDELIGKQLKKVCFYVQKSPNFDTPFRIRIYDLKNGFPENDLSNFNFICSAKKVGWNEFDLDKYKIFIPKSGCFIAMEWLISNDKYRIFDSIAKKDMYGQQLGLSYNLENHKGMLKYNMDSWLTNTKMNKDYRFYDEGFYYCSPMIQINF